MKDKRFEIVETGAAGGVCPLIDKDGKPIISRQQN